MLPFSDIFLFKLSLSLLSRSTTLLENRMKSVAKKEHNLFTLKQSFPSCLIKLTISFVRVSRSFSKGVVKT